MTRSIGAAPELTSVTEPRSRPRAEGSSSSARNIGGEPNRPFAAWRCTRSRYAAGSNRPQSTTVAPWSTETTSEMMPIAWNIGATAMPTPCPGCTLCSPRAPGRVRSTTPPSASSSGTAPDRQQADWSALARTLRCSTRTGLERPVVPPVKARCARSSPPRPASVAGPAASSSSRPTVSGRDRSGSSGTTTVSRSPGTAAWSSAGRQPGTVITQTADASSSCSRSAPAGCAGLSGPITAPARIAPK